MGGAVEEGGWGGGGGGGVSLAWAVKFPCPWDTQEKRCHLAKHVALRRERVEDSELYPHLGLTLFPGAPKISVLFVVALWSESCEVYFSGVGLCFVPRKAEVGEGRLKPKGQNRAVNPSALIASPHPHPMMWQGVGRTGREHSGYPGPVMKPHTQKPSLSSARLNVCLLPVFYLHLREEKDLLSRLMV